MNKKFNLNYKSRELKEAIEKLIEMGFDLDKNSARDLLLACNSMILMKHIK